MSDTHVIINPKAGEAAQNGQLMDMLEQLPRARVHRTLHNGHAIELATEALDGGAQRIIAVGGDGTVSEVVQALAKRPGATRLGVVPVGTGNDLPRTLGLPDDPMDSLMVAMHGPETMIDLIRLRYGEGRSWCVNVASGGVVEPLEEVMDPQLKQSWGPLAYLRAALEAAPRVQPFRARLSFDDCAEQEHQAYAVIVANGRTAAGGLRVAPHANPEDGLMDVLVIESVRGMQLAGVAARLMAGDYSACEEVTFRRARQVCISSEPEMWFHVDGEMLTNGSIEFSAIPGALRVAVGPGYRAEAPDDQDQR